MKEMLCKLPVIIVMIVLLSGCDREPMQEIDAARRSLDEARIAQADVYSSEMFRAAEDSFDAARKEIDRQNRRFALVRTFKRPKELLTFASQRAHMAVDNIEIGKEQMRVDTHNILKETRKTTAAARGLLNKSSQSRGKARPASTIRKEINGIETSLKAVESSLKNGKIYEAHTLVKESEEKAQLILNELSQPAK